MAKYNFRCSMCTMVWKKDCIDHHFEPLLLKKLKVLFSQWALRFSSGNQLPCVL